MFLKVRELRVVDKLAMLWRDKMSFGFCTFLFSIRDTSLIRKDQNDNYYFKNALIHYSIDIRVRVYCWYLLV